MDCTEHITERKVLFDGGSRWSGNWQTAANRSVGGTSHSYLETYPHLLQTEYHGWVDRLSVDNSAFAAVHTMGTDKQWDLTGYDAIELKLGPTDGKLYHIVIHDGRPFSWVGSFRGLLAASDRVIRFHRLIPMRMPLRNQPGHEDPPPLNLGNIRGFGIYILNSDASQDGAFTLRILSISAVKLPCSCPTVPDPISMAIENRGGRILEMRARARLVIQSMRAAIRTILRRKPEK
ncbi:hypothetical protein BDW59DRAFT_159971 [Aspergillus cavernicola]|uniref:NADH:ubiquinone oxidoreductase intermediate-associated protein 30 domain-containing protein n=1 Tax=Aspergillus cavernicola TaxID=176166 RepID=A0ABR4IJV5_9EURO